MAAAAAVPVLLVLPWAVLAVPVESTAPLVRRVHRIKVSPVVTLAGAVVLAVVVVVLALLGVTTRLAGRGLLLLSVVRLLLVLVVAGRDALALLVVLVVPVVVGTAVKWVLAVRLGEEIPVAVVAGLASVVVQVALAVQV